MIKVITNDVKETISLGEKIAKSLKGNEVIAFFGGLGMGKTALTSGIAKGLNSLDDVSSPTFALVNEYQADYKIYHYDMYRINSWDDLYSTGYFDFLETAIIIVEWSENIENALPENHIKITIDKGDNDNTRIFTIEGVDLL